jgi:hypothetical protein
VKQEISSNPTRESGEPAGRIEVAIPFDGRDYFTRQAAADVESALGGQSGDGAERAVIGHLLLADHTRTDLRTIMQQHNNAGVIPIEVPIPDSLDKLTDDRHTCVIAYDYQPQAAEFYPIWLNVQLYDPDSVQLHAVDLLAQGGHIDLGHAIDYLMRTARFTGGLEMSITVSLAIPVGQGAPEPLPKVKLVSVDWPVITSLESVQLERDTTQAEREAMSIQRTGPVPEEIPHPIRYNPDQGRLEWESIPMHPGEAHEGSPGARIYHSAEMRLNIRHPGELFPTAELFREQRLTMHADVEVDGYLLSGLEAWLFDATGNWQGRPPQEEVWTRPPGRQPWQPKLTTRIGIDTEFYVTDEFAKREFRPYQQYVFDGVIPDERRITDILTVLNYSNFETLWRADPDNQSSPETPRWLLQATRREGTDQLTLLIAVDGQKYSVDQERLRNAGLVKEIFGTAGGRMRLSVLGTLHRDHATLVHEMNHLQQALRERFRYQRGS